MRGFPGSDNDRGGLRQLGTTASVLELALDDRCAVQSEQPNAQPAPVDQFDNRFVGGASG